MGKTENKEDKIKRRETIKKEKLVHLLTLNLGNTGKNVRSMKEMMLEAGYSESSANQQTRILVGVREEMRPVVDDLIVKRKLALKHLSEGKLKGSSAKDLSGIVDTLTKNIQLLSGEATDVVKYEWNEYSDKG